MRRAVTLIELLTVVAIMALLSGLAVMSFERSDEDVVLGAARELAAAADRARQLAQRTNIPHLLTIHIENAGNGRVLRNFHPEDPDDFKGRHWYAIIGPDTTNGGSDFGPPSPGAGNRDNYRYLWSTAFAEGVKQAQVGDSGHLPRGVRFVALSDHDRSNTAKTNRRPWHGRYNEDEQRIYAWGGFDPEIGDRPGFHYQGENEAMPVYDPDQRCMVYGAEVYGQIHKGSTGVVKSGASWKNPVGKDIHTGGNLYQAVKPEEKRTGPDTTVLPGTPKPLVEGPLLDWCLNFAPDGKARWVGYMARDVYLPKRGDYMSTGTWEHGGWFVTLARDIDPEERWGDGYLYDHEDLDPQTDEPYYERFPSAAAARESLRPWCRVFIPRSGGGAQVLPADHPMCRIEDTEFLE